MRIGANEIKPYLVGDSAYPLASWLQKPFPEATGDPQEIAFNKALSAARVAPEVVNRMFGNRTQSNLISRLGSVIELNETHEKILPIKLSVIEQFNNQT